MFCAVYALNPLIACCSHGLWDEAGDHHHTRGDVWQANLIKATPHLRLKRTDLVQDVHHLHNTRTGASHTARCESFVMLILQT